MSNKNQGIILGDSGGACLNVGHGGYVLVNRIVAILEYGSLPTKRFSQKATEANQLIDATAGRKTRSLVALDSGHAVLSALAPSTLHERLQIGRGFLSPSELELEEGEFVS